MLRFFGVASPEQWATVWREHQVAYRQTKRFEACAESVSAWLRKGEIEARQIRCEPFNKEAFFKALDGIRDLTMEAPEIFQTRLVDMCASAGVAVVFVPELPKTEVYGATRWLGNKALIQLSLRYKSNDHLWFIFFHEVGHIIKHGRKEIFIEGNGLDSEKEEEANAFARDRLIPPAALRKFVQSWDGLSLAPILLSYFCANPQLASIFFGQSHLRLKYVHHLSYKHRLFAKPSHPTSHQGTRISPPPTRFGRFP